MKPSIALHAIKSVELTPIRHFERGDNTAEFWVRDLVVTSEKDNYSISLFSYDSHEALMTKVELEAEAAKRTVPPTELTQERLNELAVV